MWSYQDFLSLNAHPSQICKTDFNITMLLDKNWIDLAILITCSGKLKIINAYVFLSRTPLLYLIPHFLHWILLHEILTTIYIANFKHFSVITCKRRKHRVRDMNKKNDEDVTYQDTNDKREI